MKVPALQRTPASQPQSRAAQRQSPQAAPSRWPNVLRHPASSTCGQAFHVAHEHILRMVRPSKAVQTSVSAPARSAKVQKAKETDDTDHAIAPSASHGRSWQASSSGLLPRCSHMTLSATELGNILSPHRGHVATGEPVNTVTEPHRKLREAVNVPKPAIPPIDVLESMVNKD